MKSPIKHGLLQVSNWPSNTSLIHLYKRCVSWGRPPLHVYEGLMTVYLPTFNDNKHNLANPVLVDPLTLSMDFKKLSRSPLSSQIRAASARQSVGLASAATWQLSIWPSLNSLTQFTSRWVHQSLALSKQSFFRTKEGPFNSWTNGLPWQDKPPSPLKCLHAQGFQPIVPIHRIEMLSAIQHCDTLNTGASVSKLRLLSQLISLHPKVKQWSPQLLPWYAFCRIDDSPLSGS